MEVNFKETGAFEQFRNLTPDIISPQQANLFSSELTILREGTNLAGMLFFSGAQTSGTPPHFGVGNYGMDFMVLPAGACWFGLLLGDPPQPISSR